MTSLPCWQKVKFIDESDMREGLRYEAHIFLHREVPTRPHSWHDFFNYLTWMQWPKAKLALNHRMIREYMKFPQNKMIHRNPVQNRLALLDECGLVICASSEVLNWIRQHDWIQLFHENRDLFEAHVKVFVFGHGLYEKCLNPYLGLTGHAWLCPEFVSENEIDECFAHWLQAPNSLTHKSALSPFPMLGVPGAWQEQTLQFYQNTDYFRPKTSRTS